MLLSCFSRATNIELIPTKNHISSIEKQQKCPGLKPPEQLFPGKYSSKIHVSTVKNQWPGNRI
jgi:hypothetical protein